MPEKNNKLGLPEREKTGLESYETGQWVKVILRNNQAFYGTRGNIDTDERTIKFNSLTEYVFNEKGYVLGITDEPTTFQLEEISTFRKATQEEVDASIETQSKFYQHWDKYIAVNAGGTTIPGRLHKIGRDYIQLLPVLCTNCGKAYIERKEPKTISADSVKAISPSSEEELEHSVEELTRQLEKGEEKEQPRIILS
ncbi:hypothetical protein GF343_03740 [Candidatus Woesearchaeota archaeon]|nr:hypothetical protein [Candidatus Woesearchaeota archaeon]